MITIRKYYLRRLSDNGHTLLNITNSVIVPRTNEGIEVAAIDILEKVDRIRAQDERQGTIIIRYSIEWSGVNLHMLLLYDELVNVLSRNLNVFIDRVLALPDTENTIGMRRMTINPDTVNRIDRDIVSKLKHPVDKMKLIKKFENNEIVEFENIDYYFPDDQTHLPVTYFKNELYAFSSVEEALEFGFIEDPKNMCWYKEGFNTPVLTCHKSFYTRFNNSKFSDKSKTFLLTEGKEYTFGVEFECARLFLPRYVYRDLNLDCVRDGSLNGGDGGPECVTGVLNGDSGLRHLQTICKELTSRGSVDKFCGLHLHLGGIKFSKANLVYLYKICCIIENEVMAIVPESRRDNTFCKSLKKLQFESDISTQDPHTFKLKLNSDLELLFNYIQYDSKGKRNVTRKDQHPMGAKCGYRHETPRYCWVNFVPAIFNTRGKEEAKSVEIRIHPGSTSYKKTKNWLLLWMGVLWFVENKKEEIREGLTINDIIYAAYPKRGGKIADYFRDRKERFKDPKEEIKEYQEEVEPIKSIKDQLCV
jgi:hypothetical protein